MSLSLSLRPTLFLIACLSMLAAFAPSSHAAASSYGCTVLQGQLVCALDVTGSAGSNVQITGTNLDTAVELDLLFSDGTSTRYYKNGIGNPAGSTVQWPVVGTVTRAMLDAYTGPQGFKRQIERELGMTSGQLTGIGQAIKIQDSAIGGKTITAVKLYDVTRSRNTDSLIVPTSGTSGWVPPTITVEAPEPNRIVFKAPVGLDTIDRFDITCTSQLSPSGCPPSTVIRVNRLTGTNIGVIAGTLTWSDTQVEFRSDALPGKELLSYVARKGTATGTYSLNQPLYFSPRLTAAAGTGAFRGEYKLTGGDFRLLRHMIATLDDGTTRLVGIKSGVASDDTNPGDGIAEITVQTLGATTLTIRDSKAAGHTITSLDLYYRDLSGQDTLVAQRTNAFFVNGEITSITSSESASATLNGVGFQAIVSVVFTLSDGSTLSYSQGDFDEVAFDHLKITDAALSGVTITGVTATAYDGQTMSLNQNLVIATAGPSIKFTGGVTENQVLHANAASVTFTVSGTASQTECKFDDFRWTPCSGSYGSDNIKYGPDWQIYTLSAPLGEGPHKMTVRTVDQSVTEVRNFSIENQMMLTSNAVNQNVFGQYFNFYPSGAVFPAGQSYAQFNEVAKEYADGSLLMVAYVSESRSVSSTEYTNSDSLVWTKLKADMSVDTSFGTKGYRTSVISAPSTSWDRPTGYTYGLQVMDGQVYLINSKYNYDVDGNFNIQPVIIRYNLDGTRDDTFGAFALPAATVGFGGNSTHRLAKYGDELYVLGSLGTTQNQLNTMGFVARVNIVGGAPQLDTGFGVAGYATFTSYLYTNCNGGLGRDLMFVSAVNRLADGDILVGGSDPDGCRKLIHLYRLNADGSRDQGFGVNGQADTGTRETSGNNELGLPARPTDISIVDGKIQMTAVWYNGYMLRFNLDGTQDATFNPGAGAPTYVGWAKQLLSNVYIDDIRRQSDGKYIVRGAWGTGWPYYDGGTMVGRVNADGSPDTSLEGTGIHKFAERPFGASNPVLYMGYTTGVFGTATGSVILTGSLGNGQSIALSSN